MIFLKVIRKIELLVDFYQNVKNNKLHIYELMKLNKKEKDEMSEMETKELIARINGMSKEELEVVADHIPVELCYNRIGKELKKAKMLDEAIIGLAANVKSGMEV